MRGGAAPHLRGGLPQPSTSAAMLMTTTTSQADAPFRRARPASECRLAGLRLGHVASGQTGWTFRAHHACLPAWRLWHASPTMRYQWSVPGSPLNGPITSAVIQPP